MKLAASSLLSLTLSVTASAQLVTFTSLASFDGSDGARPGSSPLFQATDGNFYGTTQSGGANDAGEVYQLTPAGEVNVIYSFCSLANCADGGTPMGGLVQAADGNLYGTTTIGGAYNCGTLYSLSLAGDLQVVHSFCKTTHDVFNVTGSVATFFGYFGEPVCPILGVGASGGKYGAGGIFSFCAPDTYKVPHSFCRLANCPDGANPKGGLQFMWLGGGWGWVGTTEYGGANNAGVVFVTAEDGQIGIYGHNGIAYNFCSLPNCADGANPTSPPVGDSTFGYGVTATGGTSGNGVLYTISLRKGTYSVLHNFCSLANCADGAAPAGLVEKQPGGIFGTTESGGANQAGTVFKFSRNTNFLRTLYSFCAEPECADGGTPTAPPFETSPSLLYGTTQGGGASGQGTVYRLEENDK